MENQKYRCFAEHRDGVFQAHCIDLCLAVQGDSLDEVVRKLNDQVESYLFDATQGVDRDYKEQLLSRKSPLPIRVRYHKLKLQWHLQFVKNHLSNICFFDAASAIDKHKHA